MNGIPSSPAPEPTGLRVRTAVKAGGIQGNHSEPSGLSVRTAVRAGGLNQNHSEAGGLRS